MTSRRALLLCVFVFTCALLARTGLAHTFHIDPSNGSDGGDGSPGDPWKTLEWVVDNNVIESRSYVTPYDAGDPRLIPRNPGAPVGAGDTLLLYGGLHGELSLTNYINSRYITIMAAEGQTPVLKKIHLRGAKYWRIEGVSVSSEPYGVYIHQRLLFLESHDWQGPVSGIEIKNCHLFSAAVPWTEAGDWTAKASDGIMIRGDSVTVAGNTLSNVRFGISMRGDYISVTGNTIENFSGDGIRIVGSNSLVEANTIKNCYAVDNNHDDGIQSFTTGGLTVDHNIVRRNIILNYADPDQPLLGPLQGIGCFDGPYKDWTVENNLIIVDHWHGISFYGAENVRIVNNTVLDPTPGSAPGPSWIKIEDLAGFPGTGCVVKNNATNHISVTAPVLVAKNAIVTSLSDYAGHFVDHATYDFHVRETSSLVDEADSAMAPADDLDGNPRPSGPGYDIGAYEYMVPLSTERVPESVKLLIFPNPFTGTVHLFGRTRNATVALFDINGRLLRSYSKDAALLSLELGDLKKGVYFLKSTDLHGYRSQSFKILKD